MDWSKLGEMLVQGLVGMTTAYFGARFAFTWNKHKEEAKSLESKVEACNRVLFILSLYAEILENYRGQQIETHRNSAYRYFEIKGGYGLEDRAMKIDPSSLAFLFATPRGREVPSLVAIEADRFGAAMTAIKHRTELRDSEFQPLLRELGAKHQIDGPADLEKLLSPFLRGKLRNSTDHMIDLVDRTIASLDAAGRTIPPLMRHALQCEEGLLMRYARFECESLAGRPVPSVDEGRAAN